MATAPRTYGYEMQDWIQSYVSAAAMDVVHDVYRELNGSEPQPFSCWHRFTTEALTLAPDLHERLRQHLLAGGIIVILGSPRFSKADLLTSLTATDVRSSVEGSTTAFERKASTSPFAIDDTGSHERQGVLTSIALATSWRRGVILVFQNASEFRAFDIGSYIANQKVVILVFS